MIKEQCEYYCVSTILHNSFVQLAYIQPKSLIDVGECIIERANLCSSSKCWIPCYQVEIVFLNNFVTVSAEVVSDNTDNNCYSDQAMMRQLSIQKILLLSFTRAAWQPAVKHRETFLMFLNLVTVLPLPET